MNTKEYSSIIPKGKIKRVPIWDIDLAFGNNDDSDSEHPERFWIKDDASYSHLFQHTTFVAKVKISFAHYKDKKDTFLSKMESYAILLKKKQNDQI